MSIKYKAFIYFLLFISVASAQSSLENYIPLQSSGEMPKVFKTHFFNRFEQRDKEIKEEFKEKHTDFAMQSSYYFDLLLQSGRLLYGSSLNAYVDNIANEILKHQPELQNKFSFFILRVPYVNAFALDPGIILVTTGLLAKIENDAQLAFILCHEMVHIIKNHNIDLFLTQKRLKKEKKDKNEKFSSNIDTRIYKYHFRSRENENEADKLGMEMLLSKTDFEVNISEGIFHVLKYGHMPLAEKVGFIKQFETDSFQFPQRVVLEKILPVVKNNEDSDTLSTHPNIEARTLALKQTAKAFESNSRKLFFTNQQDFENMRQLARFEMVHYQMINHDYVNAAYNAWIMLEDEPQNIFLQNAIATALYGITKYKNSGYAAEIIPNYREQEGQIQEVFYFFQRLNRNEMPIVALRYVWNLKKENNQYLTNITSDLASEIKSQNIKLSDFQSNISEQNKVSKFKNDQSYLAYAFVNEINSADFIDVFQNAPIKKEEDLDILQKKKKKKNDHEPIHSLITYNPYFLKIDQRKKHPVRIMTTQEKEIELNNIIIKISEKLKLQNTVFTSHHFTDGNSQYYSDYCMLSDWFVEFVNVNNNFEMHYYQNQFMEDFKKRNPAKHLNLMGVSTYVSRSFTNEIFFDNRNILFSGNIPILIYLLFTPTYSSYYQQVLVDLETGKLVQGNSTYYNDNSRNDFIKSNVYHSFFKIKKPKK